MSIVRNGVIYSVAAVLVIFAGLGSRSDWGEQQLPTFVEAYAGDTLWTWLIYLLVGVIFPRLGIWKLALGVLLFSYAVEVSQLYQAPWINRVRENPLGALALGKSFVWSDLPCYTVGVVLGVVADLAWRAVSSRHLSREASP